MTTVNCQNCKSETVIKYGKRKNNNHVKQKYLCKTCGKRFVENDGFRYRNYSSDVITVALDLYVKGVSLRDVANHLNLAYGVRPSQSTVLEWVRQYGSLIENYTKKLKPKLGSVWTSDEMQVHMKDNRQLGAMYGNWLVNLMDKKTRFLIMSEPIASRDAGHMEAVFKDVGKKGKPKVIITDGLKLYRKIFKEQFGKGVNHVVAKGPGKKENQSSTIERMNGTIRQREKVTRNYWRVATAKQLMRTFEIYYNFVRGHMALNGKTPAEMAGLELGLNGNKWKELIRKSVS